MSRTNLLAILGVAAAVVGCAQCDTCDDFPTPCIGPNCGGGYGTSYNAGGILDMLPPGAGAPAGTSTPNGTGRAPTRPETPYIGADPIDMPIPPSPTLPGAPMAR